MKGQILAGSSWAAQKPLEGAIRLEQDRKKWTYDRQCNRKLYLKHRNSWNAIVVDALFGFQLYFQVACTASVF